MRGGFQLRARQRPESRQPVGRAAVGAVGHEPHDRQDHPAGAGRLVGVREHRNHVRQHGFRRAASTSISPTATEFLAFNSSIFAEQVWFIGDALGADLDEVTATVEAVAAQQDHQIFDHLLRAGTTAGQRWNWNGLRDGETLVEIETLWTVGNEYPGHWPKPRHGWTLTIEGDPSMQTHFFSLASFTARRAWRSMCGRPTWPPRCRCSTPCPRSARRRRDSRRRRRLPLIRNAGAMRRRQP